ncbi:RNA pseudouridine synthase [Photobacterium damselae subsp. damselae]|uniref:RluA family pseudouridine synthase n=1 Tax=Photobacterium damselae TaxID=38293 RepID=UPI0015F51635|nr:RluA family pseudouridine synthase [Photobacterium damselae]MBA5682790.1 RNA pseudouridine synthase [Photobacterium damselae subsp. damselae]
MHSPQSCFTRFQSAIDQYTLPERFTFPFYYTPHPLCELAAQELQLHLETQTQWQHNFGLNGDLDTAIGKMFGVLLVKNSDGEIGYLSAFSGKIADQNLLPHFVPPVFDMLTDDGFFQTEQKVINDVTAEIRRLETNAELLALRDTFAQSQAQAADEIEQCRLQIIDSRKDRKEQRKAAEATNDSQLIEETAIRLAKESAKQKHEQRFLKSTWDEKLQVLANQVDVFDNEINELKEKRRHLSSTLQAKLFAQYRFLNQYGEEKDLIDIFAQTPNQTPPAGSGECAAPKLLHYAFKHGMTPIAMAEFWWGASPKSEIRKHKYFYEACKSKCEPILGHMLKGIELEENLLLKNPAEGKELEIIYQDEAMVIVNKPAEFLSVPGKTISDSVYTRMQAMFPDADSPLIVHRLDMSTSGLLVIALTKRAHKNLQKQFITRTVEKRYVALLDGLTDSDEGIISLPMRGDINDRPRQLVCFEHGKPAETKWQVICRKDGKTKVYYYPKTGRTHQLRVHSAHPMGMNMPIIGDDLYGQKSNRLHLHAEYLSLEHPITHESMEFQVDAEF